MNQSTPNGYYRVSVKALVLDETRTKFLATLHTSGKWTVPGGGLDWKEDPIDGLKRELKEEMGLEAVSINLSPAYFSTCYREDDIWAACVFYETTLANLDFTPSLECQGIKFVTREEAKAMPFYSALDSFIESFDPARHQPQK
jgi:8-oxo-dGTP diphosphatase